MSDPHTSTSPESAAEERLGFVHENLEGWIPALASVSEIHEALEKAFDYRGDLTLTLKSGQKIEGYIFDRHCRRKELRRLGKEVQREESGGRKEHRH
jgi:hypothetical protein